MAVERVWQDFPSNITNPIEVAVGAPSLDYRARPTYARPAGFANDIAAAVIAANKQDLDRLYDYTTAISQLNLALLASAGADKKLLKVLFDPSHLYL